MAKRRAENSHLSRLIEIARALPEAKHERMMSLRRTIYAAPKELFFQNCPRLVGFSCRT